MQDMSNHHSYYLGTVPYPPIRSTETATSIRILLTLITPLTIPLTLTLTLPTRQLPFTRIIFPHRLRNLNAINTRPQARRLIPRLALVVGTREPGVPAPMVCMRRLFFRRREPRGPGRGLRYGDVVGYMGKRRGIRFWQVILRGDRLRRVNVSVKFECIVEMNWKG